MSASWQFCLSVVVFCISVSTTSCSEVKWANPGESITIKCECKRRPEEVILIKVTKGLKKNADIFYKTKFSEKTNMAYPSRTQLYGDFPNYQILLKNLTTNDTGVYWCDYKTDDDVVSEGSVLLVVRDHIPGVDKSTGSTQTCDLSNKNLVVTVVSISSAVLIGFLIVLLLLAIRKVKFCNAENKPIPIPHNEVYEDMRGTIRR